MFNDLSLGPSQDYEEKRFSNVQHNKRLGHSPFVIWELTVLIKTFKSHVLDHAHSQEKCIPTRQQVPPTDDTSQLLRAEPQASGCIPSPFHVCVSLALIFKRRS